MAQGLVTAAENAPSATRLDFIDSAKAVGVVLVVAGHAPGLSALAHQLIYSFHIPLFFFISGYLTTNAAVGGNWWHRLKREARTLLVPYAFFFSVSLVYWLATRNLSSRAEKFAGATVEGALQGFVTGRPEDLFINIVLWFFPAIFLCRVLYFTLRRIWSNALIVLLVLLTGAFMQALDDAAALRQWPWSLGVMPNALACFAIGNIARHFKPSQAVLQAGPLTRSAMFVVSFVVWLVVAIHQGHVDMAYQNFGASSVQYLICALAGVVALLMLCQSVPANPVTRWLSINSLIIFPLHPLAMNVMSGAMKLSGMGSAVFSQPVLHALGATLWGLLACIPAALAIRRHIPFALGLHATARDR